MTTELDFARALIDAGIPVFIAPPDRHSAIGYRLPNGWQQSKPTPLALDGYEPGWAICALGGHGIDFVDVDPRNGGHLAMAQLKANGVWPREYAIVATPSGGTHHYVTGLSVAKCSREGIDLQAGAADGSGRGFVFLPGTRRVSKADGVERGYVLALDNLEAYVETIDDTSGDALRSWLRAKPSATNAQQHADTDVFVDTKPRIGDVLPAGMQDVMLTSYAASIVIRSAGRFTEAEMTAMVVEYGGGCQPPWGHAGGQTLEAAALTKIRSAIPKFTVKDDTQEVIDSVGVQSSLIDWHHLLGDDMPDEEWIIEPFIATGRQAVIYSPPKVGKSLLALELAAAVAAGKPVLGCNNVKARTVLYVDFENAQADIRDRCLEMGLEPDDLQRLKYMSFPPMSKMDTQAGGQELLALAQEFSAELVIVDTATRTIHGEENSNDTWANWYANTGLPLKRAGIALIRLDHSGKDVTLGQRGGSSKSSDIDAVWQLTRQEGDVLHLKNDVSRTVCPEDLLVLHRLDMPVLHHQVDAMGRAGSTSSRVDAIVTFLDGIRWPASAGVRLTMKACRESNQKCSQVIAKKAQAQRSGVSVR